MVALLVILVVYEHNSIREQSYLLRGTLLLLHPSLTPCRHLIDYGDESSFLHLSELTRAAFDALLDVVISGHPLCHRRRGKQWSLPPDGQWAYYFFIWGV